MVGISRLIARQLKERNIAIRKKCDYRWDNPKGAAGNSSRVFDVQGGEKLSVTYHYEKDDKDICTTSYTVGDISNDKKILLFYLQRDH